MKATKLWWLACVPLVLAACGGGEEAETAEGGDQVAADTGMMAMPPAPAAMDSMAGMGGAPAGENTIPLRPVGGSNVTGTVAVTEQGAQTQVVLTVMGAPGAGTHAAHVHQGTCDAPGQVVAPLEPVTVDASGTGSSTTTLDIPAATVMNGQHIVAAHEAGGDPGAPVTCAAIPQHSM